MVDKNGAAEAAVLHFVFSLVKVGLKIGGRLKGGGPQVRQGDKSHQEQ